MTYEFNHVHLKAEDPKAAADWYVKAFGFTIVSDATRNFGDRFIACDTIDGVRVNISNERTGETLGNGIRHQCCYRYHGFDLAHSGLDSNLA